MKKSFALLRAISRGTVVVAFIAGMHLHGATFDVAVGSGGTLSFSPPSVTINVGDTVRWTWPSGSFGHNVVCDNPFGSGTADPFCGNTSGGGGVTYNQGTIFSFTYTKAGTYPYYCFPHRSSGMTGSVTVNSTGPPNTSPGISGISDRLINTNSNTGAIPFTVSDAESQATALTVSKATSDGGVIPLNNIVLGGSGANRTVTVAAGLTPGASTITLTVTDEGNASSQISFKVTVFQNHTPAINTTFNNLTINQNGSTGPIPFQVVDVDSPASSLIVTGSSGNTTLVPNANVTFTGTDSARTNIVTPAAGQFGTALITITVDDGSVTSSKSYTLTVNALPVLNITSPANNTITNFPAPILITGTSTDPDGTIGPVVYYMNNAPVRTNSGASFQFTLTNLAAGSYAFKSVATDNRSATATSGVVNLTINPFTMTAPVVTTTQAQFSYAANPGLKYTVQGSSNLTNWTDIVTTTAATSSETFTDSSIESQGFKFYRVIQVP